MNQSSPGIESDIYSDSVLECYDNIEELLRKKPDKRKKEYKYWLTKINKLIFHTNKLAGFKAYNLIK